MAIVALNVLRQQEEFQKKCSEKGEVATAFVTDYDDKVTQAAADTYTACQISAMFVLKPIEAIADNPDGVVQKQYVICVDRYRAFQQALHI